MLATSAVRFAHAVRHSQCLFWSDVRVSRVAARMIGRRNTSETTRYTPPTSHTSGVRPQTDHRDLSATVSSSKEGDDAFYKYYLAFKFPPYTIAPSKWIHFIDSGPSLTPALQKDPLSVLDTDTEDLDLVRRCLEHFVALASRNPGSKRDQRALYEQAKAGSRTLLWLLKGDGFHKYDLAVNPEFERVAVHCIAAEGAEAYLWTWLTIDEIPSFAKLWSEPEQISWRGGVLRCLMESTTYWADDTTHGLEEALKLYKHAIDLCRTREGFGPPFIPLYPASIWLMKQLAWQSSHHVSTDLLRSFANSLGVTCANVDERKYKRVKLLGNFEPHEAYEFYRACEASRDRSLFMRDILRPKNSQSANATFFNIVQAAQALARADAHVYAKWVLDFGRRHLPHLFDQQPYSFTTRDKATSLWSFRKQATTSQIAQGVPVDRDGVGVITDRRRQVDEAMMRRNNEERSLGLKLRRQKRI